jgi:predicted dehydrogenase
MIRAGEVGAVRFVHGSYLQDWLLLETDYNWRVDPRLGGVSCAMADIGSHWVDLAQHVTGLRIEAVCSDLSTCVPVRHPVVAADPGATGGGSARLQREIRVESDDCGAFLLRFEGGARGSVVISQVAAGHKNDLRMEIQGSRQSLAWSQEEPNTLWIGQRGGANAVLPKDPSLLRPEARPFAHYPGGHGEAYPDGLKNLFSNVYRAIASGSLPSEDQADYPTFRDGHRAMQVIEATLESHKKRGWVPVQLE